MLKSIYSFETTTVLPSNIFRNWRKEQLLHSVLHFYFMCTCLYIIRKKFFKPDNRFVYFRVRLHERRNELIQVWDFKSLWNKFYSRDVLCISKWPDILMECVGISFRVAFTWYFITQNFISVKTIDTKSIPAMCFKRTLNAICNESALIHFVSGKFCSHENLMPV